MGWGERIDELDAEMTELLAPDDGVMERLDFLVAMLMTVRGDQVDTPRRACLLPGNYAQPHGLSEKLLEGTRCTHSAYE